jgi:hydroxymethylpyrimidine pyrophosphatase-like HAD family hydrolase
MSPRPKTIFCDIDGVLIRHQGDICAQSKTKAEVLPGVIDSIKKWDRAGYVIILISGRRESMRLETEQQLRDAGIFYDQLVLGCGGGQRVLINDRKPDSQEDTAVAVNLTRNAGIAVDM